MFSGCFIDKRDTHDVTEISHQPDIHDITEISYKVIQSITDFILVLSLSCIEPDTHDIIEISYQLQQWH